MFGKFQPNIEQFWDGKHCALEMVKTTNSPSSQPERCQMTFQYHLAMRALFKCKKQKINSVSGQQISDLGSCLNLVCGKSKHLVLGVIEQLLYVTALFYYYFFNPLSSSLQDKLARLHSPREKTFHPQCHFVSTSAINYKMPPSWFERLYSQ